MPDFELVPDRLEPSPCTALLRRSAWAVDSQMGFLLVRCTGPLARSACTVLLHGPLARSLCRCQVEVMKHPSLFRRIGTYLLGLVDEYWAMRRPWQYGTKEPQCGLQCNGDHCDRID